MGLVGYSDSEGSDNEAEPVPQKQVQAKSANDQIPKVVNSSGVRRIKVDLPAATPDEGKQDDRPVKRARTSGGFSGFNSMLPAPKRTNEVARRSGLQAGVSLKTSGAAAFSREPVDMGLTNISQPDPLPEGTDDYAVTSSLPPVTLSVTEEVKTVGNPMRFKPLSVANKKKPKKSVASGMINPSATSAEKSTNTATKPLVETKSKVSLFSVQKDEQAVLEHTENHIYEPMIVEHDSTEADGATEVYRADHQQAAAVSTSNSLDDVAADLNLSAADRRRLFGRGGQGGAAIKNFNMDQEYRKNEQLRAAGEAVEHRAVRAVAPGKHSLQQLVNASSTQKEALEDAWAEGKRNRGEAGNKYGWGK